MVILAAYAPTTQGNAALAAAIIEARRDTRDIVIASHAFPDADGEVSCAPASTVMHALSVVAASLPRRERAYLETIEVKVRSSTARDIGDFLVSSAQAEGASMLVVALRHSGAHGRLSLGQAVKKVLVSSPCPVLVVKDESAPVE